MGRVPSDRPKKLPAKLLSIRRSLKLSQSGMVERLELRDKLTREDISKYERGVRLPALLTLLAYARAGRTTVDVLIDDDARLARVRTK